MKQIITFSLIIISLFACTNKQKETIALISIDFDKIQSIENCAEIRSLNLDTSSKALLYNVKNVFLDTNQIVVYSKDRLSAFDHNGKHKFDFGMKGNASNEYLTLWNVFTKDNYYYLHDINKNRIMTYDASGNLIIINQLNNQSGFQLVTPFISQNEYIGIKSNNKDNLNTPEIGIFNSDFKLIRDGGSNLESGVILTNSFSIYDDNALYWKAFNDTIFSVDTDVRVSPKYIIDFGDKKIPSTLVGSEEKIKFLMANGANVAHGIQFVNEDESNLHFLFSYAGDVILCKYSKKDSNYNLYKLSLNNSLKFTPFLGIYGNDYVFVAYNNDDMKANFTLIYINKNSL